MTVLVGGAFALLLGLILLIAWWSHFVTVLAGAIPLLLLAGGALAAYLGLEELKDRKQVEQEMARAPQSPPPTNVDVEQYKQETEKYKAEVDDLKKKLEDQKEG